MPTSLNDFVAQLVPESTILLFGAGSSIPSGAPGVEQIKAMLAEKFKQESAGFSLAEMADLVEQKTKDRQRMIKELQHLFAKAKPTGGLLNIPLYPWKSIYTTNYDTLIEQAYKKRGVELVTYTSNFDFSPSPNPNYTRLFKLHGTISNDTSLGGAARIVLSGNDYNYTHEYRQHLINTLKADLTNSNLVIVGHSLADEDIKKIISESITIAGQSHSSGRITLFVYTKDDDRAILYEGRGLRVVFGGIDELFAALGKKSPGPLFDYKASDNILERHPALIATVLDIGHHLETSVANVSNMFNGWPASYIDIESKLSFERTITDKIHHHITSGHGIVATLLGASGVGKSTAARQVMLRLRQSGYLCWEHKSDFGLHVKDWMVLAEDLKKNERLGAVLIDDAHFSVREINTLIDDLVSTKNKSLSIVLVASRSSWRPRVKTPNLFKVGKEFFLSKLDDEEVERLLNLVDNQPDISNLVEKTFSGFSRVERRRRLVERCEADMFVCMRNIFATENFDDIILREYAELSEKNQEIYRLVAALETSGIRVHRQLVIRLLGLPMGATMAILENLIDIVNEYSIDERHHVYGWRGRHPVINGIITKYKFNDVKQIIDLFDKFIDNIVPTYQIEVRSIVELCNVELGISRIKSKSEQNRLLRKMISMVPGQRVPRHRLIRNLIESGDFEQAQTELRIFDKDFRGGDGPSARYKINLLVARAAHTPGILREDRLAILEQARDSANTAIRRFPDSKGVLSAHCEVGYEIFRLTGRMAVLDEAMDGLRAAETRLGDPDITDMIRKMDRRTAGLTQVSPVAVEDIETVPDLE
jgi:hypothetical protein